MKNKMRIDLWYRKKTAVVVAALAISLSMAGSCFAAEIKSLKIYPEHVGVFTTVMKQQFVAYGVDTTGKTINITDQVGWESSDEKIVTIDEMGLATVAPGKTAGQVKISCFYPKIGHGKSAELHPSVRVLLLRPRTKTSESSEK